MACTLFFLQEVLHLFHFNRSLSNLLTFRNIFINSYVFLMDGLWRSNISTRFLYFLMQTSTNWWVWHPHTSCYLRILRSYIHILHIFSLICVHRAHISLIKKLFTSLIVFRYWLKHFSLIFKNLLTNSICRHCCFLMSRKELTLFILTLVHSVEREDWKWLLLAYQKL